LERADSPVEKDMPEKTWEKQNRSSRGNGAGRKGVKTEVALLIPENAERRKTQAGHDAKGTFPKRDLGGVKDLQQKTGTFFIKGTERNARKRGVKQGESVRGREVGDHSSKRETCQKVLKKFRQIRGTSGHGTLLGGGGAIWENGQGAFTERSAEHPFHAGGEVPTPENLNERRESPKKKSNLHGVVIQGRVVFRRTLGEKGCSPTKPDEVPARNGRGGKGRADQNSKKKGHPFRGSLMGRKLGTSGTIECVKDTPSSRRGSRGKNSSKNQRGVG